MCGAAWAIAIAVALQNGPPPADPASEAWPDDRPIIRLIPNLIEDVKALPSERSLWLAAGGTLVSYTLSAADTELAEWSAKQPTSSFSEIGAVIGDGWVQGAAALFTYGVGRLHGNAKVAHTGSDLVRAQILNGMLTKTLKVSVDRQRPDGGGHSFPSGHTASAVMVWSGFALCFWLWATPEARRYLRWVIAAAASVIGVVHVAMLGRSAHWWSDLIGGDFVGLACLSTLVFAFACVGLVGTLERPCASPRDE